MRMCIDTPPRLRYAERPPLLLLLLLSRSLAILGLETITSQDHPRHVIHISKPPRDIVVYHKPLYLEFPLEMICPARVSSPHHTTPPSQKTTHPRSC